MRAPTFSFCAGIYGTAFMCIGQLVQEMKLGTVNQRKEWWRIPKVLVPLQKQNQVYLNSKYWGDEMRISETSI